MKKLIVVIYVLLLLVLLIPFPAKMRDGGTVHYNAILYDIYNMHRIKPVDVLPDNEIHKAEYIEGIIVEIFGVELFNNTSPRIDN